MLKEQNIRKGFVRMSNITGLHKNAQWLASVCEHCWGWPTTIGWRRGELLHLRVRQVDLVARTVDLNPAAPRTTTRESW